jgi:hypothetical protein
MSELGSEQLESIRRLLLEPLRETIRAEVRVSHDQLAAVVATLGERLAEQGHRADRRFAAVERQLTGLGAFRRKVLAVYGVLTVLLSLIWSVLRDKLMTKLGGK